MGVSGSKWKSSSVRVKTTSIQTFTENQNVLEQTHSKRTSHVRPEEQRLSPHESTDSIFSRDFSRAVRQFLTHVSRNLLTLTFVWINQLSQIKNGDGSNIHQQNPLDDSHPSSCTEDYVKQHHEDIAGPQVLGITTVTCKSLGDKDSVVRSSPDPPPSKNPDDSVDRPFSAPPARVGKYPEQISSVKNANPYKDVQQHPPPPKDFLPPILEARGSVSLMDSHDVLHKVEEREFKPANAVSEIELKNKICELEKEMAQLQATHVKVLQENEGLRIRLSSVMGARLTSNNPNITDLSDGNRPAKLADQFSELYDNEWTDAFAHLEGVFKNCGLKSGKRVKVTKEICRILLNLLFISYRECEDKATKEMDTLLEAYSDICGEEPNPEVLKEITTNRKNKYKEKLPKLSKEVGQKLSDYINNHWRLKKSPDVLTNTKPYTDKCLELCWLMVIQDPPVYMCCNEINKKTKTDFDKNVYREYTVLGKRIAYVVWPVLYLYSGGPVLKKGVAQCTGKKNQIRTGITNKVSDMYDQVTGTSFSSKLHLMDNTDTSYDKGTPSEGAGTESHSKINKLTVHECPEVPDPNVINNANEYVYTDYM